MGPGVVASFRPQDVVAEAKLAVTSGRISISEGIVLQEMDKPNCKDVVTRQIKMITNSKGDASDMHPALYAKVAAIMKQK